MNLVMNLSKLKIACVLLRTSHLMQVSSHKNLHTHVVVSCDCNRCEATCPLFEQTTQGEQGATRELLLTRPVWNEDKVDLRDSLIEVKDSFVKCHSMFDSTS